MTLSCSRSPAVLAGLVSSGPLRLQACANSFHKILSIYWVGCTLYLYGNPQAYRDWFPNLLPPVLEIINTMFFQFLSCLLPRTDVQELINRWITGSRLYSSAGWPLISLPFLFPFTWPQVRQDHPETEILNLKIWKRSHSSFQPPNIRSSNQSLDFMLLSSQ